MNNVVPGGEVNVVSSGARYVVYSAAMLSEMDAPEIQQLVNGDDQLIGVIMLLNESLDWLAQVFPAVRYSRMYDYIEWPKCPPAVATAWGRKVRMVESLRTDAVLALETSPDSGTIQRYMVRTGFVDVVVFLDPHEWSDGEAEEIMTIHPPSMYVPRG